MITSHLPQQNLRNNFINNEFCQFRKKGVGISVKASRVFRFDQIVSCTQRIVRVRVSVATN